MQTIISEYYVELVGLVVLATLLIIFILLKNSKAKEASTTQKEEDRLKSSAKEDQKQTLEIKQEEKLKKKEEVELKDEAIALKEELQKPTSLEPINRKKRELVPHEKITKDDFNTFNGTKILIAEDNIINQKVIIGLLSTSGIEITIANDGKEALDILEDDRDFAVIFMDAHMPNIDGFQATRLIRKNPDYNHIPIVALSGDTAADDVRNMLNVGMEAHLEKPLKMDALYDILYIYTTGQESQQSSYVNQQNSVLEFDIEKGLDICGGDKEFYLEILNDFLSKYSDSASRLQEHINGTNGVDADKMLLDISGVAANIGADELHNIAIELKSSIANPSDLTYISNLKKYKRALNRVCEAIKGYISAS